MNEELINQDGGEIRTSNNKKIYIIIFISFILIVGLIILIIFIVIGKDKNNKKDDKKIGCEPGYFLTDDDKTCKPCSISNCQICKGTKANNTCYTCDKNYIPIFENNVIETCDLDQKCLGSR